ncbi:Flp family type IVb pilin [Novosphingobium sp. B1]|uniref:Flp family type IVb pilin n=1 Tax=Novosphingobium sp. B1 TaxID=1938756 RepID=UPI0009D80E51|nr:Flp family type IVb pilin [Novosphingobium sp. B1]SMC31271.1 pilus assembly protein Flp/PilA [Novosphingobium sp. B1]
MKTLFRKIFRNESGATAIEYGLLIACIGMVMTFGMKSFSAAMYDMWRSVNENTAEKVLKK